jgi:hypothetical protein
VVESIARTINMRKRVQIILEPPGKLDAAVREIRDVAFERFINGCQHLWRVS